MAKNFKVYIITCGKCTNYILTYHKYGSGKGIIRLYFHRIAAPKELVDCLKSDKLPPNLVCSNCKTLLGVKDFQKGKNVYRIKKGYVHKKLQKK